MARRLHLVGETMTAVHRRQRVRAFTLIELMTVVAIVGVLAVLAVVSYRKFISSARTGEAIYMVGSIRSAEESYKAETLTYLPVTSGFETGGGAFYPMFAALTPDYFGENYNATNYGLVYSGKLVSGLFGSGLGSMVVGAWGYYGAYALAGGLSLVAAAFALLLRQPGRKEVEKVMAPA